MTKRLLSGCTGKYLPFGHDIGLLVLTLCVPLHANILRFGASTQSKSIGSFLVGIWPSVETVVSCEFFVFESWQIQNKHGPSAI